MEGKYTCLGRIVLIRKKIEQLETDTTVMYRIFKSKVESLLLYIRPHRHRNTSYYNLYSNEYLEG